MKKLRFILPILFLVFGAGIVGFFEFYLKDRVDTVEVLVAKNDIEFKQKISSKDIEIKRVRKENVVASAYKPSDAKLIINQYSSIEIPKGTQIYPSLVDEFSLIPNEKEGEFVAPIPDEWLFAVPGSLRRSYVADFYAIPDGDQALLRSLISEATGNAESQEVNQEQQNSEQPVNTDVQIDQAVLSGKEPVLKNIRVSSVKDRSNKEVKASEENSDTATGVIANLEIIANQEMLDTLREQTQLGNKIYVVYKYERAE